MDHRICTVDWIYIVVIGLHGALGYVLRTVKDRIEAWTTKRMLVNAGLNGWQGKYERSPLSDSSCKSCQGRYC